MSIAHDVPAAAAVRASTPPLLPSAPAVRPTVRDSAARDGDRHRAPVRLRLSPEIGRGALDGAWWPHSRDLASEAVELVAHLPSSLGQIFHLVYSRPDWESPPRRLRAARGFLNFGSFPRDDTHEVLLTSVVFSRVLRLLVVPPDTGERAAAHAMRIAATPSSTTSAAAILIESTDVLQAGLLSHWDDDGGPRS